MYEKENKRLFEEYKVGHSILSKHSRRKQQVKDGNKTVEKQMFRENQALASEVSQLKSRLEQLEVIPDLVHCLCVPVIDYEQGELEAVRSENLRLFEEVFYHAYAIVNRVSAIFGAS